MNYQSSILWVSSPLFLIYMFKVFLKHSWYWLSFYVLSVQERSSCTTKTRAILYLLTWQIFIANPSNGKEHTYMGKYLLPWNGKDDRGNISSFGHGMGENEKINEAGMIPSYQSIYHWQQLCQKSKNYYSIIKNAR